MTLPEWITIGQLAQRSGLATSALRFYEDEGFIQSQRTEGNQRRYHRSTLRRVALVRAARQMGISLAEVKASLAGLPQDRPLRKRDWQRLSTRWKATIDDRIRVLEQLRDQADSCVGCGCLSLVSCGLFNPDDNAGVGASGARAFR